MAGSRRHFQFKINFISMTVYGSNGTYCPEMLHVSVMFRQWDDGRSREPSSSTPAFESCSCASRAPPFGVLWAINIIKFRIHKDNTFKISLYDKIVLLVTWTKMRKNITSDLFYVFSCEESALGNSPSPLDFWIPLNSLSTSENWKNRWHQIIARSCARYRELNINIDKR